MRIIVAAALLGAIGTSPAWAQDTSDTGLPEEPLSTVDADGDGFSPAQGDCDDTEPSAFPGAEEICFDQIDNDCNGLYDQGCDGRVQFATLRGGGGCTGGTGVGNTAFVFLPFLLLFRRRA